MCGAACGDIATKRHTITCIEHAPIEQFECTPQPQSLGRYVLTWSMWFGLTIRRKAVLQGGSTSNARSTSSAGAVGRVYQLPHASIANGGFNQKLPHASTHGPSSREAHR